MHFNMKKIFQHFINFVLHCYTNEAKTSFEVKLAYLASLESESLEKYKILHASKGEFSIKANCLLKTFVFCPLIHLGASFIC